MPKFYLKIFIELIGKSSFFLVNITLQKDNKILKSKKYLFFIINIFFYFNIIYLKWLYYKILVSYNESNNKIKVILWSISNIRKNYF